MKGCLIENVIIIIVLMSDMACVKFTCSSFWLNTIKIHLNVIQPYYVFCYIKNQYTMKTE